MDKVNTFKADFFLRLSLHWFFSAFGGKFFWTLLQKIRGWISNWKRRGKCLLLQFSFWYIPFFFFFVVWENLSNQRQVFFLEWREREKLVSFLPMWNMLRKAGILATSQSWTEFRSQMQLDQNSTFCSGEESFLICKMPIGVNWLECYFFHAYFEASPLIFNSLNCINFLFVSFGTCWNEISTDKKQEWKKKNSHPFTYFPSILSAGWQWDKKPVSFCFCSSIYLSFYLPPSLV